MNDQNQSINDSNQKTKYAQIKQFDVINNIKAIALLMVLQIHLFIYYNPNQYWFCRIFRITQNIVGNLGVPSFFFISGFLFFKTISTQNLKISYKEKLKKRAKTLLIPYIIWNLFGCLLGFIYLKTGLLTANSMFCDFNFIKFIKYILLSWGDIPLWYVRNLIVICLLSPLIYQIIRFGKKFILFVFLLIFSLTYPEYYFSSSTIWFCVGAFCAIEKIDFLSFFTKHLNLFLILYIFSISIYISGMKHFLSLVLLSGVPLFFGLTNKYSIKIPDILIRNAFFIYCSHFFISKIYEHTIHFFYNLNTFSYICLIIMLFLLQISICIISAEALKKICNPFYRLINGNR